MKLKLIPIILIFCIAFAACGEKEAERGEKTDNKVHSQQTETVDEKTPVTDGDELASVNAAAGNMLSSFAALVYAGALVYIRESDRSVISFDNSSQKALYDCMFPKLSYELKEVYTRGGRLYVAADITAPDMLDVYGKVNLRYMDALLNGEIASDEEARQFNDKSLAETVSADDVKLKTTSAEIELMRDADGELRVVLTAELMNAMLGDIQTAQQQVSEAISEGMEEYKSAKDAGALE